MEGNVLSPKLVGDRVGLHPVWIMFALLAGGSLFGFVGILIAVPTAAVIGVIVRHLLGRYRESGIYRGGDPA
jgi:predicted PurR-regulated permease PerM